MNTLIANVRANAQYMMDLNARVLGVVVPVVVAVLVVVVTSGIR
jgi:hypothetical protein